jgi:hypothetical protein
MPNTQAEVDAYRVETVLSEDRTLTLNDLPFQAGDAVEVIILVRRPPSSGRAQYPLRGQPLHYERPTDPVAEEEWDALQ